MTYQDLVQEMYGTIEQVDCEARTMMAQANDAKRGETYRRIESEVKGLELVEPQDMYLISEICNGHIERKAYDSYIVHESSRKYLALKSFQRLVRRGYIECYTSKNVIPEIWGLTAKAKNHLK